MHRHAHRLAAAVALVALAACAADDAAPTALENADGDGTIGADGVELGAVPEQASLPGLAMDPLATFGGLPDARGGACSYTAATGRFACAPVVRNGLTVTRSYALYDAAGAAQLRRDAATASVNTEVAVAGTTTGERGTVAVDRASTLTVTGLGARAVTHTLNGREAGKTTATVTGARGAVTVATAFTAAVRDVVVPVPRARDAWPLSGTATRTTTVTAARPAGSVTFTVTEEVAFTGTSVVNVTITRDGVTRRCTRDLAARAAAAAAAAAGCR